MRRRVAGARPYLAELEGYADDYAVPAAAGDLRAIGLLRSVHSYRDQLAGCVPDQQVVDLFLFFAREDRQWWEAQM